MTFTAFFVIIVRYKKIKCNELFRNKIANLFSFHWYNNINSVFEDPLLFSILSAEKPCKYKCTPTWSATSYTDFKSRTEHRVTIIK